jgi:hypothetical protein
MARKLQSEAEKAQTPLQEELAASRPTVATLHATIITIQEIHDLSHRDAICALRDYFQWLLAAESDKALAETRERIKELAGKLEVREK